MCKNFEAQVANLMQVELPTIDGLMSAAGVPQATEDNVNAVYSAAETALANYQPGGDVAAVQQALTAALAVVVALGPIIPPEAQLLLAVAIGGIKAAIAIFTANTTAADTDAQKAIEAAAIADIQTSVPDFKLSDFERAKAWAGDHHVAANHYKSAWNKQVKVVAKVDPKYATLKQA